ncbi:MAG: phage tail protein [Clostridia bacterium]|nr:phage tail protein [Clostridia bacterium]
MIPIICKNDETKVGFLKKAIKAEVTEERNGVYELMLEYPVTGEHYSEIIVDRFIKAKPNMTSDNQFFRIYKVSKPIHGIVTVKAEHVSYALSHYPIKAVDLTSTTAQSAINGVLSASSESLKSAHPFKVGGCDIETIAPFKAQLCSARAALGGIEGSVLDTYGGELEFNNYTVNLHKNRGADNGVRITYGKNMTDLKLDISLQNSYTGIYPYCIGEDDTLITLDEGTIHVENESGIAERVLLLDCTSMFEDDEEKNADNLKKHANEYLANNDINAIEGSMSVSMIDLSKSENYKNLSVLETVSLCDTVKVEHKNLAVTVKMKVIKVIYDVLGEKNKTLELGTAKSDFADTIKQLTHTAEKAKEFAAKTESKLVKEYKQAIEDATKAITGASGGYVVLNPPKNPSEILILCDSPSISKAKKIWRFNSAGLAYSSSGYEGPYGPALLADGKFVINDITAQTISANLIRSGMLTSVDGNSYFNLDSGRIQVANDKFMTIIDDGIITQTDIKTGVEVGGLQPYWTESGYSYQGLYFKENEKIYGAIIAQQLLDGNTNTIARFYPDYIHFHKILRADESIVTDANVTTNADYSNLFAGLIHYRGHTFNGTSKQNVSVGFGCGVREERSSIALEMKYAGSDNILARLDVYRSAGEAMVCIVGQKGTTTSNVLELGEKLYFNGNIVSDDIEVSSTETVKTNIQVTDSVLSLFETENSEVYSYNRLHTKTVYDEYAEDESGEFTTQGIGQEIIEIDETTSYGFVIGEDYKTPAEILTADGEHVNLYSIAALNWKAIQELYLQLKTAQGEIETLKQQIGG